MLFKPIASLLGEHIVPGDVAGMSSGVDDIIPALVIRSSGKLDEEVPLREGERRGVRLFERVQRPEQHFYSTL